MMRQILKGLVDGSPISQKQRLMLASSHQEIGYVCVTLRSLSRNQQLPGKYIGNSFENNFPNSFSFPCGEDIVGIIDLRYLCDDGGDWNEGLTARLFPMLESLKLCAGVSNDFIDLNDARIYHNQTEAALESGILADPQSICYFFSDYALMEMIVNSLGALPVETYFPNGFKKIIKHDETSTVSFFHTLKVFLDESMSYSRAANTLYIHRSTLVDRMDRINRELGIDMTNPNQRLHLQLLIKAVEIQDLIKRNI